MAKPTPEPEPTQARFKRTIRSVRSGLRRYPRAIYQSLKKNEPDHPDADIPNLLHQICPHELAAMWLGHGSVVAQIHDMTIAVDPVLSDRIGMRLGKRTIGLPRLEPAPVRAESLRGIDRVFITHAPFDHLDRPTRESIATPHTRVVVPRSCRRLIPLGFGDIIEMHAGQRVEIDGLAIRAMAPAHWGARRVVDRHRGVNSYLLESEGRSILFAGDTAHTRAFDHLEHVDLAVFGIGAYDPWEHMHATPEQAWSMFTSIGARYLLPIHHSTFELSEEAIDEPMRRLRACAGDEFQDLVLDPTVGELLVIEPAADAQNAKSLA